MGRIASTGGPGRTLRYEYVGDTPLVSAILYPDGSRQSFAYDSKRQLTSVREGADTVLEIGYFENGLPASIHRRGKPMVRYTYRPDGRLASETQSTGQSWQYGYDARGNAIREIRNGQTTVYQYDAQDRRIAVTDPAGAVTKYAYNAAGRLAAITDALGGVRRFEYDACGRLASESDAAGRTTRYRYDAAGRVTGLTYPGGATRSFAYGPAGNLLREANPAGGITRYDYDTAGQLARVTDPVARVWQYEYSAPGQVGRVITPGGRSVQVLYDEWRRRIGLIDDSGTAVRFERDARGRVSRIHLPGGMVHSLTYDQAGRPVAEESSLTGSVERAFDDAGRLTRERAGAGAETTYRYNPWGSVAEVRESSGAAATFEYDGRGLRTAAKDAQGRVSRFSYDLLGRLVQSTDAAGNSERLSWGPAGDLVRVQEANGDTVQLDYDAAGQLRQVRHPGGATTRFEWDPLGNPVRVTGPMNAETRFSYDASGRLVGETDPAGGVTSYRYDAAGQLSGKRLADGTSVNYSYDRAGRQTAVDDGKFPVRYGYDAAGRRNRTEFPALGASLGYEYDPSGLLLKLRAPDGRDIRYSYDANKRVTAIALPDGRSFRMEYDPQGRLKTLAYPNGVRGVWERDAAGRLLKVAYTGATGKAFDGRSYEYDAAGEVTRSAAVDGQDSEYHYDASGQLTEEARGGASVRYGYLPGGNRERRDAGGETTIYKYNAADQLVAAGDETLGYDARGNLVRQANSAGGRSYVYDAANRLERVILPDSSEVRYGYAATGDRVSRQDKTGKTWFVSDGVNLIADLDESFAVKALYIHAPGVDRPLALVTAHGAEFYHTDRQGTVTSLTGDAGRVTATYTTDAFGTPLETTGSSVNRFLRAGREYDADTGLYYVRARYYDPRLGRFLSADPDWGSWADPLGINQYAYVRNAPTRYTDPSGEKVFKTPDDIWTAFELTPEQWGNIQGKMLDNPFYGGDVKWVWNQAEQRVVATLVEPVMGPNGPTGNRTVKGQELYEKVMKSYEDDAIKKIRAEDAEFWKWHEENVAKKAAADAAAKPRTVPRGEPAKLTPEQKAAAEAGTKMEAGQPQPQAQPQASSGSSDFDWDAPTSPSPPRGPGAGGGAGGGAGAGAGAGAAAGAPAAVASPPVGGPRASTFGPQSHMPTIEVDSRVAAGWALGAAGAGLSIAADMEEGKDFTTAVKDQVVGIVGGEVLLGIPLTVASMGTGALAGVAMAGSSVLGVAALGYGAYRYGAAVADRPAREADAARQHELAIITGPMLDEFKTLVDRDTGELDALRQRYTDAAAIVTAKAAEIRAKTAALPGALAELRNASLLASTIMVGPAYSAAAIDRLASVASQLQDWEKTLAQEVAAANAKADACASEADAAQAMAAYNEAVARAAYVVQQADAARQLQSQGMTAGGQESGQAAAALARVQALRDRIVGDAESVQASLSQLTQAWNSLDGIRGQFEAESQALRDRRDKIRDTLADKLTPSQQTLYNQISQELDIKGLPAAAADESPEALQNLAGDAAAAKLDAENAATRVEQDSQAAPPVQKPAPVDDIDASASYSILLLAGAQDVPAKVQACRDRLNAAAPATAGGFASLGGETKSNNDAAPQNPAQTTPDSVNLLNVTPNQPAPDTDLLSRNGLRQSMDNAQAQSDRQLQAAQMEQDRLMQQAQSAGQQPRRPGFLDILTVTLNAVQGGMGIAGLQGGLPGQYSANMMNLLRQQNGGQGPSTAQVTQLLRTIEQLQGQVGGARAVNPQGQPMINSMRLPQQPGQQGSYQQQLQQLGLITSSAQRQALQTQPSQQPQTQPKSSVSQPAVSQPAKAATPQPLATPVAGKTPSPTSQSSPAQLTCEQKSCPQCLGKAGGTYPAMPCETCIWAERRDITWCKQPNLYNVFNPQMVLYCPGSTNLTAGSCPEVRMEWNDLLPKDVYRVYLCGLSPASCLTAISRLKNGTYFTSPAESRKFQNVTYILPPGL